MRQQTPLGGSVDLDSVEYDASMNATIEFQIRACEARLCAALLAADVAELGALIADD